MISSSRLIENAVEQMASLPGIGRKTAMRLVLHLLKRDPKAVEKFADAFSTMRNNIRYCRSCHNVSDQELCQICMNNRRDRSLICVVEDIRDIQAIESTQQYHGLYHVLGGIISPMDGIGPNDLNITSLLERLKNEETREVILALSATMEGDTTNFYLYRKFSPFQIRVSTLARGVSVGDELEYADEVTLGRSILHRTPFESSLKNQ